MSGFVHRAQAVVSVSFLVFGFFAGTAQARCWGPWGWTSSCGPSGYAGKLPTSTTPSGNWGGTYSQTLHRQYGVYYDNYYYNGDSYNFSRRPARPYYPPPVPHK